MKTALIAGVTGLIGSQLLNFLLAENHYDTIIALSRKPLAINHPKLRNKILEFDQLPAVADELIADDIFCCLGTTMKKAGSKEQFRKVDYEYPVSLATIGRRKGAKQFLVVTALGADKNSRIFYNKVKGEVEEKLLEAGFETLHIFRPSLLAGSRPEVRRGESLGLMTMKFLRVIIPKKYRVIDSAKVARGMAIYAREGFKGVYIHESAELQDILL